jgi:hypothetical protein
MRMEPDAFFLARLVAIAALIGATIEYVEILKRRVERRTLERQRAEIEREGLKGLVRVLLAEPEPQRPARRLVGASRR